MEIRSVTLFCEPDFDPQRAADFFARARTAFGYPVQTMRAALPPLPDWWATPSAEPTLPTAARTVAARWQSAGADYVSLGPVLLRHDAAWLDAIPPLLSATNMLFTAVEICDRQGNIDLARSRRLARIVQQLSGVQANGFGNLYLTALANCAPGSPFFPVAYHPGGAPNFALAIEGADIARTTFQAAGSLTTARDGLVHAIESAATTLTAEARRLASESGIAFHGLDFSLAPFPTSARSLAGAMEDLGPGHVGAPGSLFAAAFIADAIGRAQFPRCGFSGVMLPVLEDAVLAERSAAGELGLPDLLSYAAVCGVGLDTVPLPGDTSVAALAGIYLDVAALAARLDKPLTARLMPLPGLSAGDPVRFDFPYFADSRVMAVPPTPADGLLQRGGDLPLDAYSRGDHDAAN